MKRSARSRPGRSSEPVQSLATRRTEAMAPTPWMITVIAVRPSAARITLSTCSPRHRDEVEHQRDDEIHRDELDALVPVRASVAGDQRADEHPHEERADLRPAERQLEGLRRDEVAREHQYRRDEERDLDAAPERDADAEIHLVPQRHRDRRARLGGAADDREDDDADEDLRHAERGPGTLGGADEDLTHPRREHRRDDEAPDRASEAPARAVMVLVAARLARELLAMGLEHEDEVEHIGREQDDGEADVEQ